MASPEEAKPILHHLLSKLQEPSAKHYERYHEWIESHPGLEDFLYGRLRPEVLRYLQRGVRLVDAMKSIGGDLQFKGRAVYVHGVAGLDNLTRMYIGQSNQLSTRIWKQHHYFRYRRDNPSLHYYAVQNSTYDVWAVLATLPAGINSSAPGMDRPDLVLNILEMWCGLLFRCLPRQFLREYLPSEFPVPAGPPDGLNIDCPLDHGLDIKEHEWVDMSQTQDPLVKEACGHRWNHRASRETNMAPEEADTGPKDPGPRSKEAITHPMETDTALDKKDEGSQKLVRPAKLVQELLDLGPFFKLGLFAFAGFMIGRKFSSGTPFRYRWW